MKPVFIASTPNSQKDDRKIAKKLIFQPSLWKEGNEILEVSKQLSKYLNSKYLFTFNTGRASLYSIFQSIGIKPKDEIIIQAFTCLAVPLSVKWAKATPVYVDIDPKTFNPAPISISGAISAKTRAIVVQHTFGIPALIDEIKNIVDEENKKRNLQTKIYLIEDLAQSLGSLYKGKKLGEFGDVAMMSFGQDKVISCTQGGAVATNNDIIGINLTKQYSKLSHISSFSVIRNLLHPILWNIINKTYYFPSKISIGKGLILFFRVLGLLKNQADPSKINLNKPDVYRLSNAQSTMLLNQLNKLDKFIKHRKKITNIYEEVFHNSFKELSLLRYPLVLENSKEVVKRLKDNKIIPGNWYNNPIHPKGTDLEKFNYKRGSCPNAEELSTKIINLPTSIKVSAGNAQKILRIIKNYENLPK